MANAINSLQAPATPVLTGTRISSAKPAGDGGVASAASPGRSDKTSFSAAGGLIAQVTGGNDVRLDKVAALQAAIANKTYNVPAAEVAGKMIDSLLA